jgi:putative flippase GtrA
VLAAHAWTVGEPYSFVGNFKKVIAILMMLPTAALIAGFVVMSISFLWTAILTYKALASDQLSIDVLSAAGQLFVACLFGMALAAKLKA